MKTPLFKSGLITWIYILTLERDYMTINLNAKFNVPKICPLSKTNRPIFICERCLQTGLSMNGYNCHQMQMKSQISSKINLQQGNSSLANANFNWHHNFSQTKGLVNKFLSWRVWIPLSRLTFGAYLLHPLVIFYFFWSHDNAYHYQDNLMVSMNTVVFFHLFQEKRK